MLSSARAGFSTPRSEPAPSPHSTSARRRFWAFQALAATAAPAPRGRLEPAFGVTPGGLLWIVEPLARRLVLREPGGVERAAFPLGDEGHVLGVADSGARVTAPTPDGFRRRLARSDEDRQVEARYVFRFADGSVRATVATTACGVGARVFRRRGLDPPQGRGAL